MLITKEFTARMEACIKQTHVEFTRLHPVGAILEINGGAACFSGVDSFFSQVIGWGFLTKPKSFAKEIKNIERFYSDLNHPRVAIELCPLVGNDLAHFLSHRGYLIDELNTVSCLDLTQYENQRDEDREFIIKEVAVEHLGTWARVVAIGFAYPEAEQQFHHYVKAKGVTAFAAFHQGKMIAGATIAIHGDVADLGVTSTLVNYRAKGLQKRLLVARLNYAKQQGLALATVTTEAGSISDLNCKKVGFCNAYTRIKLSREF